MDKKEMTDALTEHAKAIEVKQSEMQAAIEKKLDDQVKALQGEIAEHQKKYDALQKQSDELDLAIQKAEARQVKTDDQPISLEKGIRNLFDSEEFKAAKKAGFPQGKNVFSVKADTSDITGTVNMTMQNLRVGFAPERQLAFMPYFNTGTIGQDKNRVLWVEGSFTSNVGYVTEGTGQATADSGAAVEKTRGLAKISAKLPLTAELLEDADYVASAFRMKMQEKAMIFVDGELYDGDGDDSVNTDHIYGIKGHATAYNITTTGSTGTVERANIGDLMDDCILQAELSEQRGLNKVWMNPKDFKKFKTAKDANGQYLFIKAPNGQYSINGLDVIRTSKVADGDMLLADTSKIQLWWKRNPEIKISNINGTDFVDDKFTAVMFLRNQVVVEGNDKTALIFVDDIDAAIAALNAPTGN